MPRQSVPSYRLHKASGQARTIIDGRHIYLGKFNSPESRQQYARLIAELSEPSPGEQTANPVGSKNSAELKVPHFTRFTACQIGQESTG